ncbi:aquaporin AQPAe.a-like isoform X2 [Atheta coriaria]|uniref:aquaporin AQPAe.a-like isoform X2 n=1 Tax=Dalotia coriaria TaxID=877792 RepID=UPI0031F3E92D
MASKIIGFDEIKENKGNVIWRAALAEFVGNLLLNLFGCATVVLSFAPLETALTFGFMIYLLVQTLGHVSGGHFNPAVSIAMFATCNIGLIKLAIYIAAQCAGAIAGSAILKLLAPGNYEGNYGNTVVNEELINVWQAIAYEFFLGFILVFVVFGFCDPDRPETNYTGSLAVGISIAVGHIAFIDVTGSSMNPARSLGSAMISNGWKDHYVFWVGPIAGAVVAALLYRWIFAQRDLGYQSVPSDEK